MKKVLLGIATVLASYSAMAQVQFKGISPATVASYGNIDFGVQANEGGWPGETDDGTWAMSIDFNQPNTFITGQLILVDDGTSGTNATFGNNLSEEGCSASPANAYAGKIALVRRNTCNFSDKVYYAQQAGAIAVVVINREDALTGMLGSTNGTNDTIPAIFISKTDGDFLLSQMANDEVVTMFLGNKTGTFSNDLGSDKSNALLPTKTATPSILAQDGVDYAFTPGIEFINYGTASQSAYASAIIKNPAGTVIYSDTVGPVSLNHLDTADIFPGNANTFALFSPASYTLGEYTLTYNLFSSGVSDDDTTDNTLEFTFNITDDIFSYAHYDASTSAPKVTSYPQTSSSYSDYKACIHFFHPSASRVGIEGVYMALKVDTSGGYDINNEAVNIYAYEWNSDIVLSGSPDYTSTSLSQVGYAQFYPDGTYDIGSEIFVPFEQSFVLTDNQHYLFCLQTTSELAAFGYDGSIDFNANLAILDTIIFPIGIDGTWYGGGWTGNPAPAIGLKVFPSAELGIAGLDALKANAYPNPTNDKLTIVLSETGSATVNAVDVAGKTVISKNVTNANGQTTIDMNGLQQGVYIFTVTLENGKTTQFNVVKQ